MQTFLPYPSFYQSASTLDRQRLGKQRVEVLQLLRAIKYGGSWSNHPAAKMWAGHINALVSYGLAVCCVWINKGYKDTCVLKIMKEGNPDDGYTLPDWLGDYDFHASHRSNLLRKDFAFYSKYNWKENPDLPYVWPIDGRFLMSHIKEGN